MAVRYVRESDIAATRPATQPAGTVKVRYVREAREDGPATRPADLPLVGPVIPARPAGPAEPPVGRVSLAGLVDTARWAGQWEREAVELSVRTGMPISISRGVVAGQQAQDAERKRRSTLAAIPPGPDGQAVTEDMARRARALARPPAPSAPPAPDSPKGMVRGGGVSPGMAAPSLERDEPLVEFEPGQVPGWPKDGRAVVVPDRLVDNPTLAYIYVHSSELRQAVTADPSLLEGVTYAGPEDPSVQVLWDEIRPVLEDLQRRAARWQEKGWVSKAASTVATGATRAGTTLVRMFIDSSFGTAREKAEVQGMLDYLNRIPGISKLKTSENLADRLAGQRLEELSRLAGEGSLPEFVNLAPAIWNAATFNLAPLPMAAVTPEQHQVIGAGSLAGMMMPGSPGGYLFRIGAGGAGGAATAALARFPWLAGTVERLAAMPVVNRLAAIPVELGRIKAGELSYAIFTPENLVRIGQGQDPLDIALEHMERWLQVDPQTALFAVAFGLAKGLPGKEAGQRRAAERARQKAYDKALEDMGLDPKTATDDDILGIYWRHARGGAADPSPVALGNRLTAAIRKGLVAQRDLREQVAAEYRAERIKRSQQYVELRQDYMAQGMSAEEATAKARQSLAGPLLEEPATVPKGAIPALADADWELLRKRAIAKYPGADKAYMEVRTGKAIGKMRAGVVLQANEIGLIGELLLDSAGKGGNPSAASKRTARAVTESLNAQRPFRDRVIGTLLGVPREIGSLMRAMWASGDISYAFRQLRPVLNRDVGNWLTGRPSIDWLRSLGKGVRAFFSESRTEEYQQELKKSRAHDMLADHGQIVHVGSRADPFAREEGFSSRFAEKFPLVRRANRAAAVMGNTARVAVAEQMLRAVEAQGRDVTPTVERRIANSVGLLTGRANLPRYKGLQAVYNFANEALFSPRYLLARAENVATLYGTLSRDPVVRAEGIRRTAGAMVTTVTAAYVARLFGAEVELDPRSTDFLKARWGDYRVDLTEGWGQVVRLAARLATGQTKSASGRIESTNSRDELLNFLRSKSAPLPSLLMSVYTGRDWAGYRLDSPADWAGEIGEKFIYGWLADTLEAYKLEMDKNGLGDALTSIAPLAVGAAANVGIGVQAYPESAYTREARFKDRIAREAHDKSWQELSARQQKLLNRRHRKEMADFTQAIREEREQRDVSVARQRAEREQQAAGREIRARMPQDLREAMDSHGITPTIERRIGSDPGWELSAGRFEQYRKFFTEALAETAGRLVRTNSWKALDKPKRTEKLLNAVGRARNEAQRRLRILADREARQAKEQ